MTQPVRPPSCADRVEIIKRFLPSVTVVDGTRSNSNQVDVDSGTKSLKPTRAGSRNGGWVVGDVNFARDGMHAACVGTS